MKEEQAKRTLNNFSEIAKQMPQEELVNLLRETLNEFPLRKLIHKGIDNELVDRWDVPQEMRYNLFELDKESGLYIYDETLKCIKYGCRCNRIWESTMFTFKREYTIKNILGLMNKGPKTYNFGRSSENPWREVAGSLGYLRIESSCVGGLELEGWKYKFKSKIGKEGQLIREIPFELGRQLAQICRESPN